jgi:hypothetical protein
MARIAMSHAVLTKRAMGLLGVGVTVNVKTVNMVEMRSGAHAFVLTDLPARIAKGVHQEYSVRIVTWSAAEALPALGTERVAVRGMAHACVMLASLGTCVSAAGMDCLGAIAQYLAIHGQHAMAKETVGRMENARVTTGFRATVATLAPMECQDLNAHYRSKT